MNNRTILKPTKLLVIYQNYIDMEFTKIKDYINETRELIKSKQKDLEGYMFAEISKVSNPLEEDEIVDYYIDNILKYDQTYIELLMNSTFITSFALFESSCKRICEMAGKEAQSRIRLKDLSGDSVIDKSRKYLEKVVGIQFESLNQQWNEIKNYCKVRNILVHNASDFKTDKDKPIEKQEMYSFIVSKSGIQLKTPNKGKFYISDQEFIISFCDQAIAFLNELISKVLVVLNIKPSTRN